MAENNTQLFNYASDDAKETVYVEQQERLSKESESYWKTVAKRFSKNKLAMVSLVVFILIVLVALFAEVISPYPRDESVGTFQSPPSSEHLLGTDGVGRDMLTRLIHGTQVSLVVGFGSVAILVFIGVTVGMLAGYFGGAVDSILMRITEAFQSFPYFLVVLTLVSIFNSGLGPVTIIMGVLGWPKLARLVRSEVLRMKSQDFVQAAIATGYSTPSILFTQILPNLLSPILVNATFSFANNILLESSLSFLGVGVEPPRPSWGNILADAQSINVLTTQPWRWIPAGILILVTVLSVNFIAEGLREAIEGETKH